MQMSRMKAHEDILENAPLSIVMVQDTGKIVYANEKTSSVFGYTSQELIGQPLAILFTERYTNQHSTYVSDFCSRPSDRMAGLDMGLTGLCRDGTEVPVEIRFAPVQREAEVLIVVYIVDIKTVIERRLMEEEVQRFKNRLGLLILDDG